MGTMNAMPMMYALELKKQGYEVLYFVDVPKTDTLSRPENHFPDIYYPYPPWIVELTLPSQIFLPLFPKIFAALYNQKIRQFSKKTIGCFVLSGFFSSLAPYLSKSAGKVGLPHGSDLDTWANTEDTRALADGFKNKSIFKYLPNKFSQKLIEHIVKTQYAGYSHTNAVAYFPIGFNSNGDKVLHRLVSDGVKHVPRYDISFDVLKEQSREFKIPSEKINIFSGVRFLYRTFSEGNSAYNKGNDLIIEGIGKYFSINSNIEVHFVEKGADVIHAKELCKKLGLNEVVVWHKEMPFKELLELYKNSDICFDQLGEHWIAGIGGYAMWLGKPLIANNESAVRSGVWPQDNPVCAAKTPDDVFKWMIKLGDVNFRKSVSERSKKFAENYLGPFKALNELFEY